MILHDTEGWYAECHVCGQADTDRCEHRAEAEAALINHIGHRHPEDVA